MTVADASLKQTLRGFLLRYDEAAKAILAATPAQGEEAERKRLEAEAAIWALEHDVSDLLFMLLRAAIRHDPERLRRHLMDLLAPDVGTLVKEILKERGRR